MGSKNARLRKRHELAARRKAAEAKKNRVAAEEARRAALKRDADGPTTQPDATAAADGGEPTVDESSRLFKRKVKARKLSKTAGGLHESAETLKKRAKKNGDDVDPEIMVKPASKTGSGKIMTKIVAVVAAVATLGSVVIAALYSA